MLTAALIAAVYLIVCLAFAVRDFGKYLKTRTETEIREHAVLNVYSEAEIAAEPALGTVKLYHFPSADGKKGPCVIYLPGGSYKTCHPRDVCFAAAEEASRAGCSAFVLTYRVGKDAKNLAPVSDAAAGIRFLLAHAEELNVDMDGYMLTGFSAGGHLAALFASEEGCGKVGVPRPAALGLAYPVIHATQGFFESWNVIEDFVNTSGRRRCMHIMLGRGAAREEREKMNAETLVTRDYPPVFMVQGGADFLARPKNNADLMASALRKMDVPCEYRLYPSLTHGFGIGSGTSAEGWNRDAIRFWLEHRPTAD